MKITIFINDKKQESFWLTPVREEYLKHLLKYNIPLREIFESGISVKRFAFKDNHEAQPICQLQEKNKDSVMEIS